MLHSFAFPRCSKPLGLMGMLLLLFCAVALGRGMATASKHSAQDFAQGGAAIPLIKDTAFATDSVRSSSRKRLDDGATDIPAPPFSLSLNCPAPTGRAVESSPSLNNTIDCHHYRPQVPRAPPQV